MLNDDVKISPVWAALIIVITLVIALVVFIRSTSPADCYAQHSGAVSKSETVDVIRNTGRC